MAGYSATRLEQKLGVKPGLRTAVLGAPAGFVLHGVEPFRRLAPDLDLILCFVSSASALRRRLPRLEAALAPTGSLWLAWPKRSSGAATDLAENRLRELVLPDGLVDNKVCAIDETWSGLRFVVRVERRAGWGQAKLGEARAVQRSSSSSGAAPPAASV